MKREINSMAFLVSNRCPRTVSTWIPALLMLWCFSPTISAAGRLQWEQKAGYRVAPLNVPKSGHSGFTLLRPDETQIRFTNTLSYAHAQTNQNLLNGAGVAAGDFDGDGLCDLYFC